MNIYKTDSNGFLKDYRDWDIKFLYLKAKEENIEVNKEHIFIVEYLRDYYSKHNKSLAIRALVKSLRNEFGDKIGNSLYLQSLFPVSPAIQAAKLAGLPKPKKCI